MSLSIYGCQNIYIFFFILVNFFFLLNCRWSERDGIFSVCQSSCHTLPPSRLFRYLLKGLCLSIVHQFHLQASVFTLAVLFSSFLPHKTFSCLLKSIGIHPHPLLFIFFTPQNILVPSKKHMYSPSPSTFPPLYPTKPSRAFKTLTHLLFSPRSPS